MPISNTRKNQIANRAAGWCIHHKGVKPVDGSRYCERCQEWHRTYCRDRARRVAADKPVGKIVTCRHCGGTRHFAKCCPARLAPGIPNP